MEIRNIKNPEDVAKIYPWLIPTETETRVDIASELYGRLKERPDDILILVAIERNITRAILIAKVTGNKKYVKLVQYNSEEDFRYKNTLFEGMEVWAKSRKVRGIKSLKS